MYAVGLALVLLSAQAWAQAGTQNLTLREDLQRKIGLTLCDRTTAALPQELWQRSIYDAQMQASWIEAENPIDSSELEEAAKEQALQHLHKGYAFGFCSSTKAWLLSTPAPSPVIEVEGHAITFTSSIMKKSCASFDLDVADATHGLPRSLRKRIPAGADALQINAAFLKAGTLSLTCHPPDHARRGPELWALVPIGVWDQAKIPLFEKGAEGSSKDLLVWIQKLRAAHQLKPLKNDKAVLKRFAKELVGDNSIKHPRALLLEQARQLKQLKGKLLGENRVKAVAAEEMAWLLWHSPQHRRLLLHKEANSIGFEVSRSSPERLFVMVLARL